MLRKLFRTVPVVGTSALRSRELQHTLRPLEKGAALIRKQLGRQRVALLFGSEKFGPPTRN